MKNTVKQNVRFGVIAIFVSFLAALGATYNFLHIEIWWGFMSAVGAMTGIGLLIASVVEHHDNLSGY